MSYFKQNKKDSSKSLQAPIFNPIKLYYSSLKKILGYPAAIPF